MRALQFWKAVTMDRSDFLERVLALLEENAIPFCAVGGVAANAWSEPLVTRDLAIVIAFDALERVLRLLRHDFKVRRFEHSINVSDAGSKLRLHIQIDPRYAPFVDRAQVRDVLGLRLPVAAPEDVLRAKMQSAREPTRRRVKRLKDLVDIERLIESRPELAALVQ